MSSLVNTARVILHLHIPFQTYFSIIFNLRIRWNIRESVSWCFHIVRYTLPSSWILCNVIKAPFTPLPLLKEELHYYPFAGLAWNWSAPPRCKLFLMVVIPTPSHRQQDALFFAIKWTSRIFTVSSKCRGVLCNRKKHYSIDIGINSSSCRGKTKFNLREFCSKGICHLPCLKVLHFSNAEFAWVLISFRSILKLSVQPKYYGTDRFHVYGVKLLKSSLSVGFHCSTGLWSLVNFNGDGHTSGSAAAEGLNKAAQDKLHAIGVSMGSTRDID